MPVITKFGNMPRFLTLLLLLFATAQAHAQHWEFGVQGGAAGYQGDLNQRNLLNVSGIMAGLLVRYNVNGYVSIKGSFSKAQIEAADSTSKYQQQRDRNLSFFTPFNEIAIVGELNFMKYLPGNGYNSFTPFIYGGVATANYTPQATYRGETYNLRSLNTEQIRIPYKTSTIAVPFGAGVKYNAWGKVSLVADVGYRTAYTDRLDDVSGLYAYKSFITNPVARALSDRSGERTGVYLGSGGTQRGDNRKRDTYVFFSLGISYTFLGEKCYYK
jgi:hypothetical protein